MDVVSQADEIDELFKAIVRLGGLHLLMSYMGAVGKIMGGSGLEDMWYEINRLSKHIKWKKQYAVLHAANTKRDYSPNVSSEDTEKKSFSPECSQGHLGPRHFRQKE
ncbi:hypothetical protein AVEN_273721-1 [Araneus ventricosus]|uniref:Uncharacterized protein n=1 Tax=Araneus ventricosus TaxID=182803 RepID=A0A4Y2RD56_ARAVE|nr:hypothetical protein AVEN_273721-1 [Araneus ventricosus]